MSPMTKLLVSLLVLASALEAQTPAAQVSETARQAYLYAYPLVLMEFTRAKDFPANDFAHLHVFPDEHSRRVVRPNADTLYSSAWLDLSREPVLLHVPDTKGRYYLMQLMDAWTETISVPGKRTTGTEAGWFAIVGPGWKGTLPARAARIDCPTNMAWLLGRTQTNTASDYAAVRAIQKGYTLMPLSLYPDGPRKTRTLPNVSLREPGLTPPQVVARLSPDEFFSKFAELLVKDPPHAADGPMAEKLNALGVRAGQPFEAQKLGPEGAKAFDQGVKSAAAILDQSVHRRGTPGPTGWSGGTQNVGRYGTNYAMRAVVARIGLGANPPEDAVYLACGQDASGTPLTGAKAYELHFDKSQLPVVRAFWSVTMYDEDGYFIANPINRFAIGDRDDLKYNQDGSLDLYIQRESPGKEKERNWLPAPAGAFNLSLRLYWPGEEILGGRWAPPAVSHSFAK